MRVSPTKVAITHRVRPEGHISANNFKLGSVTGESNKNITNSKDVIYFNNITKVFKYNITSKCSKILEIFYIFLIATFLSKYIKIKYLHLF